MTNPLFRNAARALEAASQGDATIRVLARALSNVRGFPRGVMRQARRLMNETAGLTPVQRYGKVSDFVREQIISEVLRQLGDLGGIVEPLIRPATQDVQRGNDIVRQILEEIQELLERPHARPRSPSPSLIGTEVRKPSKTIRTTPDPERTVAPEDTVSRQVIGRRYQFERTDPILTGEMIDVTSSDVYSIGYDWNPENPARGTLKVRFRAKGRRRNRSRVPGPLYYYFNVHPEVFMAFQRAASKGDFVWDRLRVRGTVSGSRFHYELEDTGATDYIPRKATRLGPNEYFLKRQHTDKRTGRVGFSQMENEFVQRIGMNRHGPQGFVPSNGAPYRGTPNRGR